MPVKKTTLTINAKQERKYRFAHAHVLPRTCSGVHVARSYKRGVHSFSFMLTFHNFCSYISVIYIPTFVDTFHLHSYFIRHSFVCFITNSVFSEFTKMVTLLRIGLRATMVNISAYEKSLFASSVFNGLPNKNWNTKVSSKFNRLQFFMQTGCIMNSKRNVHHTQTSTLSDDDSSSDSDDEKGESNFWRRKMRTLHSHLDINKDGVISYDDFMLLAERFENLGHLSKSSTNQFRNVLKEMWQEQWGEISPYNLVSVEKYLDKMHHVLNDRSLKQKYHHFLPYLFKAVDKDKDGVISVEEYKLFFKCMGLTNEHAIVSFSHIDTNDDGKITMDEFVTLGRDFFITEDDTRASKHFWGPLVD